MKISILCSSADHPINPYLDAWIKFHAGRYDVKLSRSVSELGTGDILFLISCNELVTKSVRDRFSKTLLIHASPLPVGRGWSPHVWQIIEGKNEIVVTLLEAEDKVDSGDIWHQITCQIPRHALWDEINAILFSAEVELMDFATENFDTCEIRKQNGDIEPTYYRKRTPMDSEIDPYKSIEDQIDLIRVCDPSRFPPYFKYLGHKYIISIRKADDE